MLRSCSNCSDGELEAKIIAQITCIRSETSVATAPAVDGPPALAAAEALASAETKADTDEPLKRDLVRLKRILRF